MQLKYALHAENENGEDNDQRSHLTRTWAWAGACRQANKNSNLTNKENNNGVKNHEIITQLWRINNKPKNWYSSFYRINVTFLTFMNARIKAKTGIFQAKSLLQKSNRNVYSTPGVLLISCLFKYYARDTPICLSRTAEFDYAIVPHRKCWRIMSCPN